MRNLRSFDCKEQYQTMQGLNAVQYISEYFVERMTIRKSSIFPRTAQPYLRFPHNG